MKDIQSLELRDKKFNLTVISNIQRYKLLKSINTTRISIMEITATCTCHIYKKALLYYNYYENEYYVRL